MSTFSRYLWKYFPYSNINTILLLLLLFLFYLRESSVLLVRTILTNSKTSDTHVYNISLKNPTKLFRHKTDQRKHTKIFYVILWSVLVKNRYMCDGGVCARGTYEGRYLTTQNYPSREVIIRWKRVRGKINTSPSHGTACGVWAVIRKFMNACTYFNYY